MLTRERGGEEKGKERERECYSASAVNSTRDANHASLYEKCHTIFSVDEQIVRYCQQTFRI